MALCTRAASKVARPSRNGEGLAHRGLSAWGRRQGIQSLPSPARPRRLIPAGRRRLAGQGDVGEELWTKGNPWVAVGKKGAHHRGLAVMREDDDGWTTARTGGRRRRRCRHGRTTDSSSSSWSGGEAGGARTAAVNGDPREIRRWRGELACSTSMADGSSSNSVLEEEVTTESLFLSLDGDGSGSAVVGHGKQSRRGVEQSRAVAGWREGEGNGRRVPLLATCERVRTAPRGAVVTGGIRWLLSHHAWCHALATGASS
jgi:hypothetical protein